MPGICSISVASAFSAGPEMGWNVVVKTSTRFSEAGDGFVLAINSTISSRNDLLGAHPSARVLEESMAASIRLPCRSGNITTSSPNSFASSRIVSFSSPPMPYPSPLPFSPTNTSASTISSTCVKIRAWFPGKTTDRGNPRAYCSLKIATTVPKSFDRSRGPYTL